MEGAGKGVAGSMPGSEIFFLVGGSRIWTRALYFVYYTHTLNYLSLRGARVL